MSLWDAFKAAFIGPAEVVPPKKTFKPTFWEDMYVTDKDGVKISKFNPIYFASNDTVTELENIFSDLVPRATVRPALGFAKDSAFNEPQAWFLEFPVKRFANAGLLASYWLNHSYEDAERLAREEISHIQPTA